MVRNYRKFYALLQQLPGADKDELVMQFSDNRTTHLSEMTDFEFQLMLPCMQGYIEAGQRFDKTNSEDVWRKRVMASIGGWLRSCGTQHTVETIKAIACRAAQRKAFNDITLSELRAIYAEFNNKQKIAKRTENLHI
jgi:GH18 family chitinase